MAAISTGAAAQKNYTLNSPDGRISVEAVVRFPET